jgi:hypothetical protein
VVYTTTTTTVGTANRCEVSKEGRGDGTAAAYAATVLSFPHYWIFLLLSGTLQTFVSQGSSPLTPFSLCCLCVYCCLVEVDGSLLAMLLRQPDRPWGVANAVCAATVCASTPVEHFVKPMYASVSTWCCAQGCVLCHHRGLQRPCVPPLGGQDAATGASTGRQRLTRWPTSRYT